MVSLFGTQMLLCCLYCRSFLAASLQKQQQSEFREQLVVEVQAPAKSTWPAFHTTMSVWCLNWVMTVFIGIANSKSVAV